MARGSIPSLLGALAASMALSAPPAQARAPVVIYADALSPDWQDWSFAVDRDLGDRHAPHGGKQAIAVTAKPWGCLVFNDSAGFDVSGLTTLSFWVDGGAKGGQTVSVILNGEPGVPSAVNLPPLTPGWRHVEVRFADAGLKSGALKAIWLRNSSAAPAETFYVDDVELH